MKRTLLFLGLSFIYISVFAQIYAPEGLNMPGTWNGWTNPPTNNLAIASSTQVTGGRVTKITTGTARYQTIFSAAASGADFTGGTYAWVFTSGSSGSPWSNKWGSVGTVTLNSIQSYTLGSGVTDNSITLTNGKWYTMNWKDIGYSSTTAIFMETSAAPVDITTVTQTPLAANVFPGQSVAINITTSAAPASDEKIYVRYSTNDFTSSTLVQASFAGTAGTATIPALSGTVKYYVFSTTVNSPSSDFDLYTIKLNNNTGTNYSYTVASSWITTATGDWSSTSTWQGGVIPISGQPVTINHDVTLDQQPTIGSLTINAGKTFTASDATPRTLTISAGKTLTNDGNFVHGSGTIAFAGAGTISGTAGTGFNHVTLAGGVNFGSASTINGTLTINGGGYVNTSAPSYAPGSTLQYNSGGTYGRGTEWSGTSGVGYPANVKISNNTTLNMGAFSGATTARQCAGNLTIDAGSVFTMNAPGEVMTAPVTVLGYVDNSGTATLSGSVGGDLKIQGNLTDNGTFNANNRAVFFNGGNLQEISGSGTFDLSYVRISKSGGFVKMMSNLTCAGPTGGNAMEIEGSSSVLDLNGFTLTLGQAGVSSTYNSLIATPGVIRGSSTSVLSILGTGNFGTVKFDQTTPGTTNVLKNLTIDRTSSGLVTIGNNLTVKELLSTSPGTALDIPVSTVLTIGNSCQASILGSLTNNATVTGLVIRPGGSLIQNSAGVAATVERDIAAWGSSLHGWHFLSSPVAAQAIAPAFTNLVSTDYDFYTWWEPTSIWVNFKNTTTYPTWNDANGGNDFIPGKGYLVEYAATDTKRFTGTLNKDNVNVTGLTRTGGSYNGWNLVGNPFTSALKWNDGTNWTIPAYIAGIAKIWDEAGAAYVDIAPNGYIPALNGFMVQVLSGSPASITIPAAARVHNATPWYKSTENPAIVLVAADPAGQTAQENTIRFDNAATPGFDPAFDSHFLAGYAPQFYSVAGSDQLSTNTLPEVGETVQIPLDFIRNDGISFTIRAKAISNINGPVFLKDLKTNITQDLTVDPVYAFTSAAGDPPGRFLLTFSHVGIGETSNTRPISVISANNTILISDKAGTLLSGEVFVYNMMGQLIQQQKLTGNLTKITLNTGTGYYLVKVVTSDQTSSVKIFINK